MNILHEFFLKAEDYNWKTEMGKNQLTCHISTTSSYRFMKEVCKLFTEYVTEYERNCKLDIDREKATIIDCFDNSVVVLIKL